MARAAAKRAKRDGRKDELARRAAAISTALGDPTRLAVLRLLGEGEKYVGELCEAVGHGQPAVSHHLAVLRIAGVVAPRREGKLNYYRLTERGRALEEFARRLGE